MELLVMVLVACAAAVSIEWRLRRLREADRPDPSHVRLMRELRRHG